MTSSGASGQEPSRRVYGRPSMPWKEMTAAEKRAFAEEFADAVLSTRPMPEVKDGR